MPEYLNDSTLPTPSFPGSHIAMDEDYVFLSGLTVLDIQGGENVLGDISEETRMVMRRIHRTLESVGCDLSDTVRVDMHITNLDDVTNMDAAYAEFFDSERYPARTCSQSPRIQGGANVEITLMARRRKNVEEKRGEEEQNDTE